MKGLVFQGPGKLALQQVPKPQIIKSTDAIVKITASSICGTDLHICRGNVPEVPRGLILGHEAFGIIEETGKSVTGLVHGDKVIVKCITSCGACQNCQRNLQSHCVNGGWILGHTINGLQAEYARIPYASNSLIKADPRILDKNLLLLSDVFQHRMRLV